MRSKRTPNPDAKATALVVEYAIRFGRNRGLKPEFPRLVHGMMREVSGWPVRNADGGANIAYFNSADSAESAISKARRAFRETFSKEWSA